MGVFKDLTGMRFGRLTVIERAENSKDGKARWKCRCDCGNICIIQGKLLFNGNTNSCGCYKRQHTSERCLQNLTGMKFGHLTVLERAENQGHYTAWLCKCDCGNTCVAQGYRLKNGKIKSCGCLRGQNHGMKSTKVYRAWQGIKQRCFNPKRKAYKNYGGRGITMYPEWVNDFQAFYDYVSKLPHFGEAGYSLDRINNDGNYEPDNVRWADRKTQSRNRRNNRVLEYEGEQMCLAETAEKSGIQIGTLRLRLKRGETGEYLFRLPRKRK